MNIYQRKILLRKEIESKRAGLSLQARQEKEQVINQRLIQLCEQSIGAANSRDAALMTYMPFRSELNIAPVMEWCWRQGIRVIVPRSIHETKQMTLHEIANYDDVTTGSWGIREPLAGLSTVTDLSAIPIMLIPGLAFDQQFHRLGYGGGFYDRFLNKFTDDGLKTPLLVAPAFDIQIVPRVPVSWNDVSMDMIVTETRELRNKPQTTN